MPSERPRAMLIVAKSRGRPSRLLRSVSVTNSSSSLPTSSDIPMMMLPAASSEVSGPAVPPLVYSGGLRNPLSSEMSLVLPRMSSAVPSAKSSPGRSWFLREIVSVSIE